MVAWGGFYSCNIHQGNRSDKERKIVRKKSSFMNTNRFNTFFKRWVQFRVAAIPRLSFILGLMYVCSQYCSVTADYGLWVIFNIKDKRIISWGVELANKKRASLFERTKLLLSFVSFALNCIKKLSRFWGKFSITALGIDNFYVKYCSVLKHYRMNVLNIRIVL